MAQTEMPALAFIGFGEAGQALASGFREAGVARIAAWDILFPEPAGRALADAAASLGVRVAQSAEDSVRGADLVIAAVTASSSAAAAAAARPALQPAQFYADINSVSPGRKAETGRALAGAARYVDMAVMAPVHPARHRTPVLLAGADADALLPLLQRLDMRAAVIGREIGAAAAVKMVRSVMVKGMEALTAECFLAARRGGVEDQVLASLSESFPGMDWPKQSAYNLERMAAHGIRRAAEMREVADTLRELGVEPLMTVATAARQEEVGRRDLKRRFGGAVPRDRAAILAALDEPAPAAAE